MRASSPVASCSHPSDRAEDGVRPQDGRQLRRVDVEGRARLGRPLAGARIEQSHRGGVRGIDAERPRRAPGDPRAGQHEDRGRAVDLGLVTRQPGDLRGDVPGVEVAARELAQGLGIHALGRRLALLAGAPVAPDQRGMQRAAVAAAATRPSSWEPKDSATISRPAVAARTSESVRTRAVVHSAGVLLGPPGARVAERVRRVARGDQRPVGLQRLRAGALRADVDADDEGRARGQRSPSPGPRRRRLNVNASATWCSRETSTATPSAARSTWSTVSSRVPRGTSRRRARSPSALRGVRSATPWSTARPRVGERGVDRSLGDLRQLLGREVLDPAPVGHVDDPAPVGRADPAQRADRLALRRRRAPRPPRPERERRPSSPPRCRASSPSTGSARRRRSCGRGRAAAPGGR